MTKLEQSIEHCKEVINTLPCGECKEQHEYLLSILQNSYDRSKGCKRCSTVRPRFNVLSPCEGLTCEPLNANYCPECGRELRETIYSSPIIIGDEVTFYESLPASSHKINEHHAVNAIVSPCNIGDTVYIIVGKNRICEGTVDLRAWNDDDSFMIRTLQMGWFKSCDFSKFLFFNKKDAENALNELEDKSYIIGGIDHGVCRNPENYAKDV